MSNVNLHDEALTLFREMGAGKHASSIDVARLKVKKYNERRKELTAALKPILTAMQERFEAGETIGASASMKEWCATYKGHGAFTYARVRQIITGTSGNENKK